MTSEQWEQFKLAVDQIIADAPVDRVTIATISVRWIPETPDSRHGTGYTQTDGTDRGFTKPAPPAPTTRPPSASIYDWTARGSAPRPARVTLDGKEITHVSRCDTAAGWVERYVTDAAGQFVVVTVNGEQEVKRETLFGAVKVFTDAEAPCSSA